MAELKSPAKIRVTIEAPKGVTARVTVASAASTGQAAVHAPAHVTNGSAPLAGASAEPVQAALAPAAAPTSPRPAWPPLVLPRVALPADWRARSLVRVQSWARTRTLAAWLFYLALGVYTLTRLIGLSDFPLYFFTDEAIQTVLAADFIRDGYRNFLGELFPTYFQNGPFWNLSVSVYAQVLPFLIFGKSIFVTRATSVLITVAGAVAVGLILKQFFKASYWWAGVLLLSVAPSWFLHSRTAFETAEMVALYACFLYFYLKYRYESPRCLYAALVFGALSFYGYSPGQMVMVVSGALLALSDLRYHWQNRRVGLMGVGLLLVLALPLARFRVQHPDAAYNQLRERGSYLVDPRIPLAEKVQKTADEYLYGLSPGYWYVPNGRDISRHIMKGYGNLPTWTFPLAVIGLLVILRHFRSSSHRLVLIALLASPSGGALAEIGITRVLMFVIPATLMAALGLEWVLAWMEKRGAPRTALALGVFALLTTQNVLLLRAGLVDGPTWFTDYGLGGMQYGTQVLFADRIPGYLARDPRARVSISPSWANGPEVFARFFLTVEQQARVDFGTADWYTSERRDLTEHNLIIMPADEYARALENPRLANIQVQAVLLYPDGTPGFYVTHMQYSAEADALFEEDRQARQANVTDTLTLAGQTVTITHSQLGGGSLNDVVDGDRFTLGRGLEANPILFDFAFPAPRSLTGVSVTTGSMVDFTVTLHVYADGAPDPQVYSQTFRGLPSDPTVEFDFQPAPQAIHRVSVEISDNAAGPTAAVHVREITFR